MSIENPELADEELPTEFGEAIDGLALGMFSIEQVRAGLAAILQEHSDSVTHVQSLLDAALRDGRLSDSDFETLAADIDRLVSEDAPTEWSKGVDEFINEQRAAALQSLGSAVQVAGANSPRPQTLAPDTAGPAPEKLGPGVVLRNRFRLESHIEAGSMGEIYKATDFRKLEADSDDPSVAIKVISEKFSRYPNALKALQQEAANGQRLSHPNIVRVFDFDRHGNHFYMTMEWLKGESLVSILNGHRFRPLPFDKGKIILDGMCKGLIYAHKQGVVHADIKPGNIFVTELGEVKLLDFGIARAGHTAPGGFDPAVIGAHTPAYSSCEVLEGQTPNEQDDVYSLACIVYRIFAGRRAFSGFTALESESHGREPKPIETLSSGQWQALRRAMAYRREDRTPDVATFLDEFSSAPRAEPLPHIDEQLDDDTYVDGASRVPLILGLAASVAIAAAVTVSLWPREAQIPGVPAPPVTARPIETITAAEEIIELAPLGIGDAAVDDITDAPDEAGNDIDAAANDDEAVAAGTAEPASRVPEYLTLAQQRMDEGFLVEPAGDNATHYLRLVAGEDSNSPGYRQGANRLANLMMLEAMIAITDKNFLLADRWLERARAMDTERDVTTRVTRELAKAREAETARESEAIGTIFASTTPAAVLGGQTPDLPAAPPTQTQTREVAEKAPAPAVKEPEPAEQEVTAVATRAAAATEIGGELAELPTDSGIQVFADSEPVAPAVAEPDDASIEEALAARRIDSPPDSPDAESDEIPLSSLEFTRFVEPKYPRRTSVARTSGWVELRFRVNEQGHVDDVLVVNSEPPKIFDGAATRAVSRWRFKPNLVNGTPTASYSGVRLRFESTN